MRTLSSTTQRFTSLAALAQLQADQFARTPRVVQVDATRVEHYALQFALTTESHATPTPWHACVLRDRVSRKGEVLVYLTDGDWRTEVPNRVLCRVLDGQRVLIELHANSGRKVSAWVQRASRPQEGTDVR